MKINEILKQTKSFKRDEEGYIFGLIFEKDGSPIHEKEKEDVGRARMEEQISWTEGVLWNRNLLLATLRLIFSSIFQSVLLYGAETWVLNKKQNRTWRYLAIELDFWRISLGCSWSGEELPRVHRNQAFLHLFRTSGEVGTGNDYLEYNGLCLGDEEEGEGRGWRGWTRVRRRLWVANEWKKV